MINRSACHQNLSSKFMFCKLIGYWHFVRVVIACWVKISADDFFTLTVFLIFPSKIGLTFHANCLLRRQFAWNVIPYFLGGKKWGKKKSQFVVCWFAQIMLRYGAIQDLGGVGGGANKGTCPFLFKEQGNISREQRNETNFGEQGRWEFWKSFLENKRTWPVIFREQRNMIPTTLGGPQGRSKEIWSRAQYVLQNCLCAQWKRR